MTLHVSLSYHVYYVMAKVANAFVSLNRYIEKRLRLFIFPSISDGKIQWPTSSIENVADFCHFVT